MEPGSPGAVKRKDHNGTVGFVEDREAREISSEMTRVDLLEAFFTTAYWNGFSVRRSFNSIGSRGAVNGWLLLSESTLEARPCTTGNTASRRTDSGEGKPL